MKKQIFSYSVIVSLLAISACTKRVETTVVEHPPQRVVIEQRNVPSEHVINKKRVVHENIDEFGRPIVHRSETTTEEYDR